jgi:hypothetical protein
MNTNNLRPIIQDILRETLGNDVYIPVPISARLKTGQRVIRLIGSSPYYHDSLFKRDDGTIWVRTRSGEAKLVPDDGEHDDLGNYRKWEWRVLSRGPEMVQQALQTALEKRGCSDIEVQVGGDRCYNTSIAFKYRASDLMPGPPELSLLFSSLPPKGSKWSLFDRDEWFETARRMFDLMYGPAA